MSLGWLCHKMFVFYLFVISTPNFIAQFYTQIIQENVIFDFYQMPVV